MARGQERRQGTEQSAGAMVSSRGPTLSAAQESVRPGRAATHRQEKGGKRDLQQGENQSPSAVALHRQAGGGEAGRGGRLRRRTSGSGEGRRAASTDLTATNRRIKLATRPASRGRRLSGRSAGTIDRRAAGIMGC